MFTITLLLLILVTLFLLFDLSVVFFTKNKSKEDAVLIGGSTLHCGVLLPTVVFLATLLGRL